VVGDKFVNRLVPTAADEEEEKEEYEGETRAEKRENEGNRV
jgi:hypothetical protein